MQKCVLCGYRPANTEDGYCPKCQAAIKATANHNRKPQPWRYVTFRGYCVAVFQNGGDTLRAELVNRNPEKIAKRKLLDINVYQRGFRREQIRRIKAVVLSLAHA